MIIITRAECRLRPPTKRVPKAPPSEGLVVHCSKGRDPSSESDALAAWRAAQAWHQKGCGWRDIAYSLAFNNLGMVMEGRGWDAVTGAAVGFNRRYRHVMWQGTPGKHAPTRAAFDALDFLIEEHDRRFGEGAVFGHSDVSSKPCPGAEINAYLSERYGDRNPYHRSAP